LSDPALTACDAFIEKSGVDTATASWRTSLPQPPTFEFDDSKRYYWNIETSQGPIRIKLLPSVAPKHVSSTMYLARLGFYDNLKFHRVITGFMAQGGCPLGTGTGGPGYQYAGECVSSVRHNKPGLLSMANAGPGTDGSQFFLTFVATPWLDDKHTILGEIVEGMDTMQALEQRGSESGQPSEPLEMRKSTISVE